MWWSINESVYWIWQPIELMTDEWCDVCPLLVRRAKQSINYLFTEIFTQKSPPSTTGQTTTQMINHFGSDKEKKIVFVRSLGRFWFWFSLSKLNIYDLRTWECGRKRFFLSFNRRVTCVWMCVKALSSRSNSYECAAHTCWSHWQREQNPFCGFRWINFRFAQHH